MRLEEIARARALDCDTIEIWFADEARIGQKNKITRRWAKRGTRPSAPRDQRTASTYIFGAICPKQGKVPLENHVHRITPVGTWVLINEIWYNPPIPAPVRNGGIWAAPFGWSF